MDKIFQTVDLNTFRIDCLQKTYTQLVLFDYPLPYIRALQPLSTSPAFGFPCVGEPLGPPMFSIMFLVDYLTSFTFAASSLR